ncbi:MAG: transcription antitermination factor NusB [Clostridia bacterium]|nr:transcription antitermination factor NusB [Clostridia bacterium]
MALTRRKEREIVFSLLFAARFQAEEDPQALLDVLLGSCEEEDEARQSAYIRETFLGALSFREEADRMVAQAAVGWRPERLSRTVSTVLTLALYEMKKSDSVPERVAINEAVELAKAFGEDGAGKFVNGVLGSLAEKAK